MAILEFEPRSILTPEHTSSPESEAVIDVRTVYRYEMPGLKYPMRVEVVGPNDYRIDTAIEIEIASMAQLGDLEDEVREEFKPHRYSSIYFLGFNDGSEGRPEDLLAMGRIIPSSEKTGNKSFTDLAQIPDWHSSSVPESSIIDSNGRPLTVHSINDVVRVFMEESGCDSLDKVLDVATMAPKLGLGQIENVKVAEAIIASFTQETIRSWKEGKITHVASFNEEHAHKFFKALGYPFKEFLDLAPMMYDSFKSGEGMNAQIAWVAVEDLANSIKQQKTKHMGVVAAQSSIILDLDAPTTKHIV